MRFTVGPIVVQICAFEVPPSEDEAFVAASPAGATMHRALREDADFRFVAIGPAGWRADVPFSSHCSAYEVAHEDGRPEGAEGTTLINPFEVPDGEDERFISAWAAARDVLAGRQGYQGTRLHRSEGAADFRFVNVARWSSPLMFARALQDPAFQVVAGAMPFASHPALYLVERAAHPRPAR